MKAFIDFDMENHLYDLRDSNRWEGKEIEITEEEYEDYKKVMSEFDNWQEKLEGLFKKEEVKDE